MSKLHSTTSIRGRAVSPKQQKKRSRASQRNELLSEELQETLLQTRIFLRGNESKNIDGRFCAFQETLSRFQAVWASSAPETFTKRSLSVENIYSYVKWVNDFEGVIVGRAYLEVSKKKGKAWADQHRAKYLGEEFFVHLLEDVDKFVAKYHVYAKRMNRLEFMQQCLIKLLKRTYSPKHKQAGDTLLICDQAVKQGPTRRKLVDILSPIDISGCKKGREIVDLLENNLMENDGNSSDEEPPFVIEPEVADAEMDDVSSQSTAESRLDLPPAVLPPIPRRRSLNSEGSSTDPSIPSLPRIPHPSALAVDWQSFPRVDNTILMMENLKLKQEVERLRRQLVVQQVQHMSLVDPIMPNSFYPLSSGMELGIPQMQIDYQNDLPMTGSNVASASYGLGDSSNFALNPTPVSF